MEKLIRDPVHDVIAFRLDHPVERLSFNLINTMEFQRLRRVRQLGLASLAYPGADHSRYSHSLGVFETARKMLDRLAQFHILDPRQRTLCLLAALLHDLGHGPFSHLFERISETAHEDMSHRLILDPDSAIHQILASHDAGLPQDLVAFLRCHPARTFYHDMISSQLDADRFDYLLRDNLHTGARYGSFDLGWLLQAITIDETSNRLAVAAKGISAVETYLQARYHMFRNVYFHKVVRSAEGMVKLSLQRARRLAVQERLPWPSREHAVYKMLVGQSLSTPDFVDLDDISIMMCFKIWAAGDDPVLANLCRGLLSRRLYKSVDITRVPEGACQNLIERAKQAVAEAGGDPAYDVFCDDPANAPYQLPSHQTAPQACPPAAILVKHIDGHTTGFAETSPLVEALNLQLAFRRIHVNETYRPMIVQLVG